MLYLVATVFYSAENKPMSPQPTIWALLVGVNHYKDTSLRALRGCRNDVEAMRTFLMNQLNVPQSHIKVLVDEQATRTAILRGFKKHLIENPKIQRGDQLLFMFSGHGSRMRSRDLTEPDGWDETLVAYDSRLPGVFDIPDKTLAALLDQLTQAHSDPNAEADNITVILDCCHSGSGTRALDGIDPALARTAPADDRLPPLDLDADIRAGSATRSARPTQSGWSISHLLLAGCLDYEESYEYAASAGIYHGAMTYFTLEYLKNAPANATYGDLYASVKPQVNRLYRKQTPQCEGNRDRVLFGGAVIASDPFIPITQEGDGVRLAAGLVHGMHPGAQLAVFPLTVKTRQVASEASPLATVEVQTVSATTAQASFLNPPQDPLPIAAHAMMTAQVYTGIQQRVFLKPAADHAGQQALADLRANILDPTGDGKPSPHLRLVDGEYELQVTAEAGQLVIRNNKGDLLVQPADFGGAQLIRATRQALESIARYRALQALNNEGPSQLGDKVKLGLQRWRDGEAEAIDLAQAAVEQGAPLTLRYHPDDPDSDNYLVTITNQSSLAVYPYLFYLSPDFSIELLYPDRGQQERLDAGLSMVCPRAAIGDYTFGTYLPGDHPGEERWVRSQDMLKLIVTTEPSDLSLLEQEALAVPAPARSGNSTRPPSSLAALVDAATSGIATRHVRPVTSKTSEEWTTVELPLRIERTAVSYQLTPGQAADIELGDGIVLAKPAGFGGEIAATDLTQAQTARSAGLAPQLPPMLALQPALFQPITRSSARGAENEPLLLTLQTDEVSRQSITLDNPLRLRLPSTDDEELLAVAFDGEDYLPVGYASADDGALEIAHLPQAVAGADPAQPASKGAGHALHLFILKQSGRKTDRIGLRCATLDKANTVHYSEIDKLRFKSGDRIALFVHGFTADTAGMVHELVPFLRSQDLDYTHLLTYDYETFGTGIAHNAETLALALRQRCGLHASDGVTVDIFAHGMGALVARCLVDLNGCHELVDRVVLAGPPNNGTMLASLSRGLTYLLAAILNGIANLPLANAVPWLVQEFYEQGVGWAELVADSDLVRQLNALDAPNATRYLVLAGNNERHQVAGSRLNRLAQKLLDNSLDGLFGETEHDLVIGMSSMRDLRAGNYPHWDLVALPCNHFEYFSAPEAQQALRAWLQK